MKGAFLLAPFVALGLAVPSFGEEVTASPSTDTSVTIYRAPGRNGGTIALQALGGFAVITETRRVSIPAGTSRLRFEGVADGIIPESAIVRGLPGGVIEKNSDSALLSPSALFRAALGKGVQLKRTDRVTGKARLIDAEIYSASDQGVVLKTAEGYETLACSGQAETVTYERAANGLSAAPTLSVMTRSARPVQASVTLTYITQKFDWSASYTARVNPDGKSMALGGWITLANGNVVSFKDARAQIVAGGLNRAYVARYINDQPLVVAQCYVLGTTSQIPLKPDAPYSLVRPYQPENYQQWRKMARGRDVAEIMVTAMRAPMPVAATVAPAPAPPPPPEQLGDLKLYRVPLPTTVAAQQMKQTRLIEQDEVKITQLLGITLLAQGGYYGAASPAQQASILLRTVNNKAHGLGLPLPAGSIIFEQAHGGRAMLIGEPELSDKAEGEEIELTLGTTVDVMVSRRTLSRGGEAGMLSPDLTSWLNNGNSVEEITLSNSRSQPVDFELRLDVWGAQKITRASQRFVEAKGRQVAKLTIPANSSMAVRYALEQ